MKKILTSGLFKIAIFFVLLLLSNFYLIGPGLWLYQDSSYWYKNSLEAFYALSGQFNVLSNSYYPGFDLGLFNYTRIVVSAFSYFLILLFGSEISQILFILTGYILSFVSFYLFSAIFIKNKNLRFYLSLMYVFNSLIFNLQGFKFLFAGIPLFIYSINKLFYGSKIIKAKYLLLNIFSIFILVAYIRFIQIAFFVIVPYLTFVFLKEKKKMPIKKIGILLGSYVLALAPIIYSFFSQVMEKSDTAFYYGELFSRFVVKVNFLNAFNFFQNSDLPIYSNSLFPILGTALFALLLALLLKNYGKNLSPFFVLNLMIVLIGVSFYGFGNIFGDSVYLTGIRFLPFITNSAVWALYICVIPLIFLFSTLFEKDKKLFLIGFFLFLLLSILPLLNLNDPKLKKITREEIPVSYTKLSNGYDGRLPESTHYIPSACWRSLFMDKLNIATPCFNNGYFLRPISFANPRLLSGIDYYFSEKLLYNTNLDNLRISHNLKNIIIANDIVKKREGTNDLYIGEKELKKITQAKDNLGNNKNLLLDKNPNFNLYSFKDKDSYDFLIYSPGIFVKKDIDNIFSNQVDINRRPVFTDLKQEIGQPPEIQYETSFLNPAKYYFKLSLMDNKPFAIQFNQSFNKNWEIRWITKKDFEKIKCINRKSFSITGNSRCEYENSLFNLLDITYLNNQSVGEKYHQRSNILNNMWVIDPGSIDDKYKSSNKVYGVIIYNKQIYYSWMVFVSISFIALISFLTFLEIKKEKYANIKGVKK